MGPMASGVRLSPAATEQAAVLGSFAIPGRPDRVSDARAFVARTVGHAHARADVAVLLASEVVTNALLHSRSRRRGGTVTLVITEIADGLRIEVCDNGSDGSTPVVKDDIYAVDGHGLYLVQMLADQWGYVCGQVGTTVWFWLADSPPPY